MHQHHMWRHHNRYLRQQHRRYRAARRVPPPILLALGLLGVGVAIVVITIVITVLVVAGTLMLPALIVGLVMRAVSKRRSHPVLAAPHRPVALTPPADPWLQAKRDFAALRQSYAEYECDPLAVLRLPALADVTVPSTARFVEAFAEAQALDTDTAPPPPHRAQYLAAVDRARRAWEAAREAAERIRSSHLPEAERSTVERCVRLLTTARNSDNDAERLVAYAKARNELARLERTGRFKLPHPARAMIDTAARGQLPA